MQEIRNFQKYWDLAIEFVIRYGLQVLSALVVLVVGVLVARKLSDAVFKTFPQRDVYLHGTERVEKS